MYRAIIGKKEVFVTPSNKTLKIVQPVYDLNVGLRTFNSTDIKAKEIKIPTNPENSYYIIPTDFGAQIVIGKKGLDFKDYDLEKFSNIVLNNSKSSEEMNNALNNIDALYAIYQKNPTSEAETLIIAANDAYSARATEIAKQFKKGEYFEPTALKHEVNNALSKMYKDLLAGEQTKVGKTDLELNEAITRFIEQNN